MPTGFVLMTEQFLAVRRGWLIPFIVMDESPQGGEKACERE